MKYTIPPQEKAISDLWRIAQKKNCDDFINIIKYINIQVVYLEDDKDFKTDNE
jgi:hypothetical protein